MNFVIPIVCIFTMAGCATFPNQMESKDRSNLTAGTVKAQIVKGETTQSEILEIFGAPNLVTKNRDNDEVWNYNRMAFQSVSGSDAAGVFMWGGSRAMSTSTTKSFDLIIIFDEKDIVKNYSVISASF